MSSIHHFRDEIAVVGWSCRLPGANSVAELWSLLLEGRCAVTRVPAERFSLETFGHPRRQERGKSYTWAAGVIDDLWGFDPTVFGISPREAEQMDPQQRILLQLTWEALEDAGITPSSIAKSDVGVFVGASQTDYGHAFFGDYGIADSHFGTGTALAILANRISYIFDLRGPSATIDTACSSSLVALHEAVQAIRTGRVETAIVGGSNVIASPASFIAFSQANMLSPNGLCQAFSARADGFVRGEGAVVMVLRKASHALARRNPVHGYVIASDVNSDGRTSGISLPSAEAQEGLLRRVYSRNGIDLDRLAFVEAHGTGTAVGDPIEAAAIGRAIGMQRSSPLPIGSIKTNIGHLEPGSGLAGLLKAMLALNHGILPPSLHFEEPNPNIDFERLNLTVCSKSLLLPNAAQSIAGVNSFGFGGTNAHVVVSPGRKAQSAAAWRRPDGNGVFVLSAESDLALAALARDYAERVSGLGDAEVAALAAAAIHRREPLSRRAVVASSRKEDVAGALDALIAGASNPYLEKGTALGRNLSIAFVYSGNGSQWPGMGQSAYLKNAQFRARFDQIDGCFGKTAGWSLKEALFGDDLAERLPLTHIAQPLIFAVQSAATAALRAVGVVPAATFGHSVGEVAAAQAAGILDLPTAVKVIYFRSIHQELVRGAGRMAAVLAPAEAVQEMIAGIGRVEIAAINSPRAVTVAGPAEALAELKVLAESRGILLLDLDLDYPFHTALMAPVQPKLKADLKHIMPADAEVPFVSTVTGDVMPGSQLDGDYWWRNVREPVRFAAAVQAVAKLGARYFVEIGPRGVLLKHIADALPREANDFSVVSVLDRNGAEVDPFEKARARALVSGAHLDLGKIVGPDPGNDFALPHYPWQQQQFRFKPTVEAVGAGGERHPFAGARHSADGLEWHAHIDTALHPKLADHKLGQQTIFPGTGFLEVALAVARQWLRAERVAITDFEILSPLDLTNGATRELMTRVSPGSNTVEIFSRPRLAKVSWQLHCRGKMMIADAPDGVAVPAPAAAGRELTGEDVYRIAETSGLHYGPAFRLVEKAVIHQGNLTSIELAPPADAAAVFLLDPMRLDCAAHGVFTLFPELRYEERGVTYIPVRVDELMLYRPHALPARAVIEVLGRSERSILVNCYVLGSENEVIAVLRRVRSQAIPVRGARMLETVAVVERPELIDGALSGGTGVEPGPEQILSKAAKLALLAEDAAAPSEASLLTEAWATAAAYEIASGLAGGALNVELLVASGRLPEELRAWFTNILVSLEAAGLAARGEDGSWALLPDPSLPGSSSVINALAVEQPSRAAEMLLAGAVSSFAAQVAAARAVEVQPDSIVPKTALDFYDAADVAMADASRALARLLFGLKGLWPSNRALRVLQVGCGPLLHALAGHTADRNILLTVFEPDRRRRESAEVAAVRNRQVDLIGADGVRKLGQYDMIVAVDGLHRLPPELSLAGLRELLAPRGLLVAVEPRPCLFKDLVFGLAPNWFLPTASGQTVSPLLPGEQWVAAARQAGFRQAESRLLRCGTETASLIVAGTGRSAAEAGDAETAKPKPMLLVSAAEGDPLRRELEALQAAVADAGTPATVVLLPGEAEDPADPAAALRDRCLQIKSCAERIGPATLWLVFRGALAVGAARVRPVETGAWAFSRTLANEIQKLDIRRIDLAPGVSNAAAAAQIARIIASGTDETELHFDGSALRAVRVDVLERTLDATTPSRKIAARLERRSPTGQRLAWLPAERAAPRAGEIEIEVEASGLNFRDLMWTLSLLPDDILEDGYTGPTLGLECAGRVSRVDPSVKDLKVGDRVMAFAASAFSTHVTVPAAHAVKLPDALPSEAAATIPVAFVTAYYSLVTLAGLKRGDWVLIHGGAGGVGMAAIQIAQARGARVIATAGSPAKRQLLSALGVRHVLDSRSTAFVEGVRAITRTGVDVVLNSLAGEAMERSIACLRPFGSFIELGKRDYVFNTHIGLRPFRRNLSYFGVDVDQLIGGRKAVGKRIYSRLMREFEAGTLAPLPYSAFDAAHVQEAFHLMQQSAHVGKIVVRPPAAIPFRAAGKPLPINPAGTHVVTGAFGGFGLETVQWLIEQGARHLVLIGRSGATSAKAKQLLQEASASGVRVLAKPCDIGDRQAVEHLFAEIRATMPPVVGVIHAAMVLDDAIIGNLDAERLDRVLAPKVRGAENLDLVTRGLALDYFVLFSSVTTLIGNPGQGNYVAANAYMEGLARRRRQAGLPSLAIGWGPIADVGVVARSERLQAGLQKLTGVTGMRAREALEFMAQALEQPADSVDLAVMTISPNSGSFGSGRLPVLRSPTYARVVSDEKLKQGEATRIDLHALAASEGAQAVQRAVTGVVVAQLARVLHAREEDVSLVRPLGEAGLDSLMGLELVMSLEEAFGIRMPISGSAGAKTVADIASEITSYVCAEQDREEAIVASLADQHHKEVEAAQAEALKQMIGETLPGRRLLS